ncbi:MAG: alpha/beta hydrolase [Candidatus Helarchaeota archaeon]
MRIQEKLNDFLTIKRVSVISMALNLSTIIFGVIYLLIPIYTTFWDITGVFILLTLFTNFLLIFINSNKLNKSTKLGNRLNFISYIFLLVMIFVMIAMLLGNFLISVTYLNAATIGIQALVILGYVGIFAFGAIYAFIHLKTIDNLELWGKETTGTWSPSNISIKIKRILKILLKIDCYLALFLGLLFSYATLMGGIEPMIAEIVNFFVPSFGLFLSFIFLSATLLLLKMKDRKQNPRGYIAVAIIGLTISGILLMPLILTPATVYYGEMNFQMAFGADWKTRINAADEAHFLATPFSIPEYFLGIAPKDCIIIKDILYYQNATEGVSLYFDAYLPPNGGVGLPGKNSTLIRIHGGGWVMGAKGMGNMMQMNKYFAAQGYCVFDVEYGLQETPFSPFMNSITPSNVLGDFTIDQMVRHIGNFTHYLAANNSRFGANLSSVFISGGSAGGQLTCATALGIWSGNYTHFFNDSLIIKGYVPFYPANGMSPYLSIYGTPNLVDPSNLVNSSSPPCFIYQGTGDIMKMPSLALKNKYNQNGNTKCAIFWNLLGGHANDMYFSGYYNQPFLYYMERFMYLCLNDKI